MTHTTPPGWYPDPGHSGDGPRQERWWDGSVWTDELRAPAPAASAAWGPPAPPPYPPSPPRSPGGRGRRVAVGVIASVVVLAVAGGFYLLGQGTDGNSPAAEARSGASAAPSRPGQEGGAPDGGQREPGGPDDEGDSPGQPRTEEGYATDAASGIAIPVPDGWKGESGPVGAGVTTGTYACPGETSQQCVRGGVFSAPAAALKIKGATAKAAAEQDIEANAEESYGGDTYGEISSHEELKAEEVTVAGQKGYLVRWKVVTAKGDDGYVQSLAFPSPATPRLMVVVRSGFDVNDKAPELSVMDEITQGIKAAAGGGGSGRDV